MSPLLESKLLAVRHKHMTVCSCTSIVAAIGAVVVGLAVGMLLDWWLDLPLWVRAGFLLIDLGILVFIVVNFMIWPILFGPDEEGIALQVEEAEPSLATRLIATVQLSRQGAVEEGWSVSLVKAMIAQTEAMAQAMNFGEVVAIDRLIKLTIAAALALLLALAGFARGYGNNVSTDLLRRALLSHVEVPRKTHIDLGAHPDQVVARGDTVRLSAKATGVVPDRGEVEISFDAGRKQYFSVERDKRETATARFVRDIENVQGSFEYRVHLGDARSAWHNVKVLTRPLATNVEVIQEYPPYTHLPPEKRALGDLSILAGSHLLLKATCNNACNATAANRERPSKVYVAGAQIDVTMKVDARDPHLLSADVPVPDESTGFTIHLVDANGLASAADAATYRIDVVQHKDPIVHITYPVEREELATASARALIGFDIHDDFGVAKVALMYKVDDGPVQRVDLDIKGEPRNLHNRYEWKLGKVAPASTTQPTLEGSNIEYWLEAVNNNNLSKKGPGVGDSEHYALRIVSEEVKRAEIAGRMAAQIDAIKNGVDDQQNLSDQLGDLVLEEKEPTMNQPWSNLRTAGLLVCLAALFPTATGAADSRLSQGVQQSADQQAQIQSSTQKVRQELGILIDELDRNGIGGEDVKTLHAIQNILGVLSDKDMDTIIQLLQQARAANDPSSAQRDVTQAVVTQKTVVVKMRELLLTYQRQQELYDLSVRLVQLAERQNTNLKGLVSLVRSAGKKSVAQYDDVEKSAINLQDGEQEAIRDEVSLLLSKLADIAKDADADTAARLTKSLDQAKQGKLEDSLRGAAEALKSGHPFQAGSTEKNARDRLYDLARLVVPELDNIARLKKAIDAVDKMMTQQQRVIDRTAALDPKHADAQTAADIEQQQGDLVDQTDRTRKDIEHLAPEASDALKDSQDHMQQTRSDLTASTPQPTPAIDQEKQAKSQLAAARKSLDAQLAKAEQEKSNQDAAQQAKELKEKIEALKAAQIKLKDASAAAGAAAPERGKDQTTLAEQDRALEPEAAAQSLPQVAEELGLARGDMGQAAQSLTAKNIPAALPSQASAIDHLNKALADLDQRLAQLEQEQKDLKALEEARDKVAKLIVDQHKLDQATDKAAEQKQAKASPATQPTDQQKQPPATQQANDQKKPPTSQPADNSQLAKNQSQLAQKTDQTKNSLPDAGQQAAAPLNDAKNAMNQAQANLDQQNPQDAQPPQQQAMTDLNKAKDALDQQIADLQKDLNQQPDPSQELANLAQQLQQAQQDLNNTQQQMADAQNQQSLQQQQQQIANALQQAAQQTPATTQPAQQALQQAQQAAQKAADDLGNNQIPEAVGAMQQAEQAMQQAQNQQGQPNAQTPDHGQPDLNKLGEQQKSLEQQAQAMADAQKAAQEMQNAAQEMGQIADNVNQAEADAQGAPESAKQAMQDATNALDKGAAAAGADQGPEAQAQAQQAQNALSEAAAAVALAQQGMQAGKMGKGKGQGPPEPGQDSGQDPGQADSSANSTDTGQSNGTRTTASEGQSTMGGAARAGNSFLLSLPPRDRDAFLQTQKEKYPQEYNSIMEQYLRNTSDTESK